jgi:putative oxidoreductase
MDRLQGLRDWSESHMDVALDIIRMYLGVGLLIKGFYFITNTGRLVDMIGDAGSMWFAPAAIAHYIIAAHIVGGFLLLIGLFTRLAAIIQIPVLLGAVFWIYMPRMISIGMREDVEFSALVLFLLVVIGVYGAGRWSVDRLLDRREGARFATPTPA